MRLLNLTAAKNIRDNTSEYVELFSRQIVINLENYFDELNRLTRTTLLNTELINALTCTEFETPMDKYNNTSVINKQLFTLLCVCSKSTFTVLFCWIKIMKLM